MAGGVSESSPVFEILSVDHALAAIAVILNDDVDPDQVQLSFNNAAWAGFYVKYNGEIYDQSVTASMMQGLIDYQFAIYRSAALILRDKQRVNSLTDEEKASFELVFKVQKGSSDLGAKADKLLGSLVERSFGRMSGKETLVCILTLGAFALAGAGAWLYFSNVAAVKKIEADIARESGLHQIISQMNKSETDRLKIVAEIKSQVPKAGIILDQIVDGFDSIIRHSQDAESIEVQGIVVDRRTIKEITAIRRRQSQAVTIKSEFFVDGTDATDNRGFMVKLRDARSNQIINANLFDPVIHEQFLPALQRAEAKKTTVVVQLNGRKIGEDILDARVLKVTTRRRVK